jgi:hypothetical protein
MGRPTGVTVIAVLDFIGAALCVIGGLLALVGASFLGAFLGQAQGGNAAAGGFAAMLGGAIAVVFLLAGAIAAVIGWGLWGLKDWARILQIVFAGLGILFGLFGLLHISLMLLIRLAINALIIWYLLKPEVAAAFKGGQVKAAGA